MKNNNGNLLGIYIHIPFCIKKCNYCDFLSFSADSHTRDMYVKALVRQIRESSEIYSERTVNTVFLGGGTPSVLEGSQIELIMNTLMDCFKFDKNYEASIECNPGTITNQKAQIYKQCGFNRISLGLQSTDDGILKIIGRIHTYEEFLESYEIIRKAEFDNVNIDIMQALPGQELNGYIEGLKKVAALEPEHISSYSLIIEENTPICDNLELYPALPDEDCERQMYYMTREILENAGYKRYEISNYARHGFECRHNITYWKRGQYVGLGLGASSFIDNVRYKNTSDMKSYLENAGRKPVIEEKEIIDLNSAMAEFMFLGLRMASGVSESKFKQCFGRKLSDVYGNIIAHNIELGLLEKNNENYRLTDRGIDVSNVVMAQFLP